VTITDSDGEPVSLEELRGTEDAEGHDHDHHDHEGHDHD